MATVADLDAEVAAAIVAQTSLTQRMISDYDDETGEQIPHGFARFRQRLDVFERRTFGSNDFNYAVQVEIDGLFSLATPILERDQTATIWLDQQVLTDPNFWRALSSVFEVNGTSVPQIVETVERMGRVLKYTAAVQVILAA